MAPSSINFANTGFVLLCASLVMLMTPGLALFYGGLVGRRNVLAIITQSFISLGWTSVLWFAFGYSMSFGPTIGGVIGDPTTYAFLRGVRLTSMFTGNQAGLPLIAHIVFQMTFAIITPALITGAFANRLTFRAYFIFLTAWLIFVYFPFAHLVWSPDGLLAKWGVRDFAGGIVVHTTAGFAALASTLYVGSRSIFQRKPHNIPLIALGAGLLWFGWHGFNAGSELAVDSVAASAFLNTDLAAAFGAITWLFVEWACDKQPKLVGLLNGCVAGLATITPAAGYVSPESAALIGVLASLACYGAVVLKNRIMWDDALDVFGVHGVGGMVGTVLLGVLASTAWNPAGVDGLLRGNAAFLGKQCAAVAICGIWSFAFTYGVLWLIDKVTPVRVDASAELAGLDPTLLGEDAYTAEVE